MEIVGNEEGKKLMNYGEIMAFISRSIFLLIM